jgi:protein SCO1/2
LREYTQYFNPTFVGVTGSNEALTGFAQQLGMLFFPVTEDQEDENYTVDHSSTVALIDPLARLHAVFSAPHSAAAIEEGLRKILKRWDDRAG